MSHDLCLRRKLSKPQAYETHQRKSEEHRSGKGNVRLCDVKTQKKDTNFILEAYKGARMQDRTLQRTNTNWQNELN